LQICNRIRIAREFTVRRSASVSAITLGGKLAHVNVTMGGRLRRRELSNKSRFRVFGEKAPQNDEQISRQFIRANVERSANVRDDQLAQGFGAPLQI
jgi:hypothetical protein